MAVGKQLSAMIRPLHSRTKYRRFLRRNSSLDGQSYPLSFSCIPCSRRFFIVIHKSANSIQALYRPQPPTSAMLYVCFDSVDTSTGFLFRKGCCLSVAKPQYHQDDFPILLDQQACGSNSSACLVEKLAQDVQLEKEVVTELECEREGHFNEQMTAPDHPWPGPTTCNPRQPVGIRRFRARSAGRHSPPPARS